MRRLLTISLTLAALAFTSPATAQLRYMATLDVSEQFNSDAFAGVQPEPGAVQQSEPDLITILQPALRLYYNWPRNLLYLRYGLTLQFHALVQDSNGTQDPADDGLLKFSRTEPDESSGHRWQGARRAHTGGTQLTSNTASGVQGPSGDAEGDFQQPDKTGGGEA